MCGRYGRITSAAAFADRLGAIEATRLHDTMRYNQPPGTFQLCALRHPDSGETTIGAAWWGFVPGWASDVKLSPINARSETANEKKMFATAFLQQRCLVAADWWYEWQQGENGKQPFLIRPADESPFFFAGIWSKAARLPDTHAASGQVTFAILTGAPDASIAYIHNRQPQALTRDAARAWLDDDADPSRLHDLLNDGRYHDYESWPISPAVGNPANDSPEIIARVE